MGAARVGDEESLDGEVAAHRDEPLLVRVAGVGKVDRTVAAEHGGDLRRRFGRHADQDSIVG